MTHHEFISALTLLIPIPLSFLMSLIFALIFSKSRQCSGAEAAGAIGFMIATSISLVVIAIFVVYVTETVFNDPNSVVGSMHVLSNHSSC